MDLLPILVAVALVVIAAILLRRSRVLAGRAGGGASEPARPRRAKPLARPLSTGTPRDLGTLASTSGRGVFPFVNDDSGMVSETEELPVPRAAFPLTNRDGAPEVSTRGDAERRIPDAGLADRTSGRVRSDRVEYHQPTDGTLQFIPGRLEIVEGDERRHEIRFVRNWTGKTEVTFGRNAGEPYRHVQLHSRTVSRLHARLEHDGDAWHLVNLSTTNPTVLNDEPIAESADRHTLNDGDKIEMGEVVFVFRER